MWIDANHDGVFGGAAREELTDYNTTHGFITLRPEVGPDGARPLAVTITSPTDIQFHAALKGHGTSCAAIAAGDGYAGGALVGMAPKAKLLSYVLDATGQDIYSLDELLGMFVHAKEHGAAGHQHQLRDFSTADLASARFMADFLDQEIASAGIVIGIAAGNEGPGLGSGAPDDYIPHHGFSLGAHVPTAQAENVYGWTRGRRGHRRLLLDRGPDRRRARDARRGEPDRDARARRAHSRRRTRPASTASAA